MVMKTIHLLPCGYWDAGDSTQMLLAGKQLFVHETPRLTSFVVGLRVRYANSLGFISRHFLDNRLIKGREWFRKEELKSHYII